MRYDDLLSEYLLAGLLITTTLLLCIADMAGIDVLVTNNLSLSTVTGSIVFVGLVAVSYPIGYLTFAFSLSVLDLVGRKKIYDDCVKLVAPEFDEFLNQFKVRAATGWARGKTFEEQIALIRMYLFSHRLDQFQAINMYWTRLSRLFAVFSLTFVITAITFTISMLAAWISCRASTFGIWRILGAGISLVMAILCIFNFRRTLARELKTYIGTAQIHWTNNLRKD